MSYKSLILIASLLSACSLSQSEFIESNKIKLFFGEEGNTQEMVAENADVFPIYIHIDIDKLRELKVLDVSQSNLKCTSDIISSPSRIATFTINPQKKVQHIAFRIKLPCAAYHNQLVIEIRAKSASGNYFIRRKIPVLITRESPGYFVDGQEYSGAILK